jgi:hypothetical protein
MEHIGIDVHKMESQICILTESGEILDSRPDKRRSANSTLPSLRWTERSRPARACHAPAAQGLLELEAAS